MLSSKGGSRGGSSSSVFVVEKIPAYANSMEASMEERRMLQLDVLLATRCSRDCED
ncbi:hypothetical protein L195_g060486 [Trifolium pratense]|uniref:Uncharacterized protein n=1 Tax=Trifolium pratense TaxID=57577 RepID=A0A2K3K472_TRIPR|nr:hypothetical protein L195_g060486 [Trifolium pratense]